MLLRRGDGGDAVRDLQRALNRLGALLVVDGDFGSGTEDAILEARARLGLPPARVPEGTGWICGRTGLLNLVGRLVRWPGGSAAWG